MTTQLSGILLRAWVVAAVVVCIGVYFNTGKYRTLRDAANERVPGSYTLLLRDGTVDAHTHTCGSSSGDPCYAYMGQIKTLVGGAPWSLLLSMCPSFLALLVGGRQNATVRVVVVGGMSVARYLVLYRLPGALERVLALEYDFSDHVVLATVSLTQVWVDVALMRRSVGGDHGKGGVGGAEWHASLTYVYALALSCVYLYGIFYTARFFHTRAEALGGLCVVAAGYSVAVAAYEAGCTRGGGESMRAVRAFLKGRGDKRR